MCDDGQKREALSTTGVFQKIKDEMTLEKVLALAIKTPGVKINRKAFLRKELLKHCPEDTIDNAIRFNPARTGIPKKTINTISQAVINYETTKVTAISVAASLPSSTATGAAVAAGAAAADITSYFAHILRVVQKLAYLYGFEQFDFDEDPADSEAMNFMLVFLGVMFGVQRAASTLNKLANTIAQHVGKKLAQKALTKTAIYPVVKQIVSYLEYLRINKGYSNARSMCTTQTWIGHCYILCHRLFRFPA